MMQSVKKIKKFLFFLMCISFIPLSNAQTEIRVLSPRTDIPKSSDYEVSIATSQNGSYQKSHVHLTKSRTPDQVPFTAFDYKEFLSGYRNAYVNFEFKNGEVWVKISKSNGNIPNMVVKPKSKGVEIFYETENDKRVAKLKFKAPTTEFLAAAYIAAVPIVNGIEDRSNAISIFANPFIAKPSQNVVTVNPGNSIPQANSLEVGETVYFKPGVHNIGLNYDLKNGVNYFLDNGSFIKGTLKQKASYSNVKFYGLGTMSGAHIKRYDGSKDKKLKHSPINIFNCNNVTIEGITIEDSAHHSLNLGSTPVKENERNYVRKVKIFTWRPEGDGIHIFQRGIMEDCFLRTQDDCMYVASSQKEVEIRRIVTWNDYNGSSFIFTAGGGGYGTTVKNCDVIYNRSQFNYTDNENHFGGSVFSMRHGRQSTLVGVTENILLEDIRIEDTEMTNALFAIQNIQRPGTEASDWAFRNVTFKNITAAANGKESNFIVGFSNNNGPENITFDCVKIGGNNLTSTNGWRIQDTDLEELRFNSCQGNPDPQPQPDTGNNSITSNYWRLENKSTGQWVRPLECSSDLRTELVVSPKSNDGNCTMFQFVNAADDHYFIINKATQGRIKFKNDSSLADDTVPVILADDTFNGWNPQWKLINTGDGYYRIQNRVTGNWIRPQNCSGDVNTPITQVSQAYTGNCTKWKLVNAGSVTSQKNIDAFDNKLTVYPNPVNNELHILDDSGFEELHTIKLYNLQGQVIRAIETSSLNIGAKDMTIDTKSLTEGLYIVTLNYHGKFSNIIKFVVKH